MGEYENYPIFDKSFFEERQESFTDKWSLGHIAVGAAYAGLGFDWKLTLALSLGWELVENLYIIPRTQWHEESFTNVCGDVFYNMLGYLVADRLGIRI